MLANLSLDLVSTGVVLANLNLDLVSTAVVLANLNLDLVSTALVLANLTHDILYHTVPRELTVMNRTMDYSWKYFV